MSAGKIKAQPLCRLTAAVARQGDSLEPGIGTAVARCKRFQETLTTQTLHGLRKSSLPRHKLPAAAWLSLQFDEAGRAASAA